MQDLICDHLTNVGWNDPWILLIQYPTTIVRQQLNRENLNDKKPPETKSYKP